MSKHVSATKQRNKVRHQIDAALIELWNLGSESHEAAIAEDRLREAEFWVSRICSLVSASPRFLRASSRLWKLWLTALPLCFRSRG